MKTTSEALRESVGDWVRQHAEKGILLLTRRSAMAPEGSKLAQQAERRHFVRYGIADLPCEVQEYTARANAGGDRERVDGLIRRMSEGTVGLIVARTADQITRRQSEMERLNTAAQTYGVLFMFNGEILDPRDPLPNAVLELIKTHLENAERRYLVAMRRLSRQQRGTLG